MVTEQWTWHFIFCITGTRDTHTLQSGVFLLYITCGYTFSFVLDIRSVTIISKSYGDLQSQTQLKFLYTPSTMWRSPKGLCGKDILTLHADSFIPIYPWFILPQAQPSIAAINSLAEFIVADIYEQSSTYWYKLIFTVWLVVDRSGNLILDKAFQDAN